MSRKFDLKQAIEQRRNSVPQKSYLWRVGLPQLNAIPVSTYITGNDSNTLSKIVAALPSASLIESRITSLQAPFSTFDAQKETFQNSYWYYAGKNDIGQINMTIHEYEDGQTYAFLNGWLSLMKRAKDGVYYPPILYKRDISVYRLDTTKRAITEDKYKGFFLSGISEVSSDYGTSDIMAYNVSFAGDGVQHTLIDQSYVSGLPDDEKKILAQKLQVTKQFGGLGKDDWARVAQSAFGDILTRL